MAKRYDTIIIGSGVGGTAAAALMSYLGHHTLLLEKNHTIGGRASTYEKDGFKFDHGHIIMRSEKGPHGEVLRLVNRPNLIPRFSHCGSWPMKTIIGDVPLETNLLMAPMAGLTDKIFRRLIREGGGCGLAYTEMVSSEALTRGSAAAAELLDLSMDLYPIGVQIYGADPGRMSEAAGSWICFCVRSKT